MKVMAELHLYDFDGTLFRSPHEPNVWEGEWWNDVRSLMPPCVPDEPTDDWWVASTVAAARRSIASPDVLAVLATGRGRSSGLRYRVPELLEQKGLHFDQVHLAPSNGTLAWKKDLLRGLLKRFSFIDTVRVWDDRRSHLPEFIEAASSVGIAKENIHLTEVRARPKSPGCPSDDVTIVQPGRKPAYVGVFLDAKSRAALAHRFPYKFNKTEGGHVTLSKDPASQLLDRVGERVKLQVTGYAEDDRIQAAVVSLPSGLRSDNHVPHVTISHVEDATPKEANTMLASSTILQVRGMALDGIIDVFPRSLVPAARVASRYIAALDGSGHKIPA